MLPELMRWGIARRSNPALTQFPSKLPSRLTINLDRIMPNLIGETDTPELAAVRGTHAENGPGVLGASKFVGVIGKSTGDGGSSGVAGESTGGPGVVGSSTNSVGVDAHSQNGPAALRAVHAGNGPGVLAKTPRPATRRPPQSLVTTRVAWLGSSRRMSW